MTRFSSALVALATLPLLAGCDLIYGSSAKRTSNGSSAEVQVAEEAPPIGEGPGENLRRRIDGGPAEVLA